MVLAFHDSLTVIVWFVNIPMIESITTNKQSFQNLTVVENIVFNTCNTLLKMVRSVRYLNVRFIKNLLLTIIFKIIKKNHKN